MKYQRKKIVFWLFVFACCIGLGSNITTSDAASTQDYDNLKKAVITAYENYQTSIDVRDYKIYNNSTDNEKVSNVFEEVINETPALFYTGREFSKEIIANTGLVTRIELSYATSYLSDGQVNVSKIKSMRKKIDNATNTALKQINSKMSDVEKALVLHDYLARTVSYSDSSALEYRLTQVGALIKRKANCQGYSVTYMALLQKAGISAKCVSSDSMGHMWNLVKIDSSWYHVDVTWDDPLNSVNRKDQYGIVLHENFLLSNTAIKKEGHYGFSSGASNKKYDNKYWRKSRTTFWYQSGKFVYATSSGVYTRKTLGSSPKRIKKINAECLVKYSARKYYLISNNKIYLFNIKSKKIKKICSAPKGSYLLQLKCSSTKLSYRYMKSGKMYTKTKKIK